MRKKRHILTSILILFLIGCNMSDGYTVSKRESQIYSEKVLKVEQPFDFYLESDFGNVEIYSWDKKDIKFEMKKRISGPSNKETLEEKLKDFKIDINQEKDKITFSSEYKGKNRNSEDKMLDLRIYMPKSVKSLTQNVEKGYIKFLDDIKGSIKISADMAQVNINRADGDFHINVNTGNVIIGGGRIRKDSSITTHTGNIMVKTHYDKDSNSRFETKTGNIELAFQNNLEVGIESIGSLEINEFGDMNRDVKISVVSGMGKISIRKLKS